MKTVPNVRDSDARAVDLQQVGAVDVAELGRDDAVDEPGQEDDLGRVLRADPQAGALQQERPAPAAQREAGIEHDEGQRAPGAGSAARTSPGTFASCSPLIATKMAMIASGTAIEMIVRGWRRRRAMRHLLGVGLALASARSPGRRQVVRHGRGARNGGARIERGGGLHRRRTVRRRRSHQPSVDGPAARVGPRRRAHRRRTGPDPAVAAQAVGRPWRPASRGGPRSSPGRARSRRRRAPRAARPASTGRHRAPCRRRRPRAPSARPTPRRRRRPCSRANSAARSFPPPTSRALWTSTQSTSGASAAIRASLQQRPAHPIERVRDADEAALLADRRDGLGGRHPGRDRRARGRPRSGRRRAVLISSPTMTVSPAGAASRARERAIDPVVVGDDQVRQPASRGRPDDIRRAAPGNRTTPTCGSAGR